MANLPKKLDIDSLTDSSHNFAKVLIITPKKEKIHAFLREDFSFGGENQFENTWGDLFSNTQNMATLLQRGRGALGDFFGLGNAEQTQVKLQTTGQTVEDWKGSSKRDLQLSLLFLAIRSGDDVRDNVMKLLAGVYPLETGTTQKAPYNYSTTYDKIVNGGWSISIGSWFQARDLVLVSCDVQFSNQVVNTGSIKTPLYAQVMTNFRPYKLQSAREICQMFPGVRNSY